MIKSTLQLFSTIFKISRNNKKSISLILQEINDQLNIKEKTSDLQIKNFISQIQQTLQKDADNQREEITNITNKFIIDCVKSNIFDVSLKISFDLSYYHTVKSKSLIGNFSYKSCTFEIKNGNLLFLAAIIGSNELADACLEKGINLFTLDDYGRTALDYFNQYNMQIDISKKNLSVMAIKGLQQKLSNTHHRSEEFETLYKKNTLDDSFPIPKSNKKMQI